MSWRSAARTVSLEAPASCEFLRQKEDERWGVGSVYPIFGQCWRIADCALVGLYSRRCSPLFHALQGAGL